MGDAVQPEDDQYAQRAGNSDCDCGKTPVGDKLSNWPSRSCLVTSRSRQEIQFGGGFASCTPMVAAV
jgi:hypothetical protein